MVRFSNVEESTGNNRLDLGEHLVRIIDIKTEKKDGSPLVDDLGVEIWNTTFEDKDGGKHYEYMRFTGVFANKTGYMFRALGLLDEDEKLEDCNKDFEADDVLGKFLYITIVENPKAKEEKYKKQIAFDGFRKYEGKAKKAKKVVEEDMEIPF